MKPMFEVNQIDYPNSFRERSVEELSSHLKKGRSVQIIGMKRVGISHFLRFFLFHPSFIKARSVRNIYIYVDLNDLVSREMYPFWVLLLKRLVDTVVEKDIDTKISKIANRQFLESIQLQDQFFTIESIREVLWILLKAGFIPTIFLVRFDRLQEVISDEFFNNLRGLVEASHGKLSFVLTGFRPLSELAVKLTEKTSISGFLHELYLKPTEETDCEIVVRNFARQYSVPLTNALKKKLIEFSGGHVHYIQLMLITLSRLKNSKDLYNQFLRNEEIQLLSEELFTNLKDTEKKLLEKRVVGLPLSIEEQKSTLYLHNAGLINKMTNIFNPLLSEFIRNRSTPAPIGESFTKKEHALFKYLARHEGTLCEREDLIEAVWPEQLETGVSDWAVDRLVARVRKKMKLQQSPYEIVTVITRGYKFIKIKI